MLFEIIFGYVLKKKEQLSGVRHHKNKFYV